MNQWNIWKEIFSECLFADNFDGTPIGELPEVVGMKHLTDNFERIPPDLQEPERSGSPQEPGNWESKLRDWSEPEGMEPQSEIDNSEERWRPDFRAFAISAQEHLYGALQ